MKSRARAVSPIKHPRRDEVIGVLWILMGLLLTISLLSYHPTDPSFFSLSSDTKIRNMAGAFGAGLAETAFQAVGGSAFLLPVLAFLLGWNAFRRRELRFGRSRILGGVLLILSLSAAFDLLLSRIRLLSGSSILAGLAGGVVGRAVTSTLVGIFALPGAVLIVAGMLLVSLMITTSFSPRTLPDRLRALAALVSTRIADGLAYLKARRERATAQEAVKEKSPDQKAPPKIIETEPSSGSTPKPKPAPKPRQEPLPFAGVSGGFPLPTFPISLLEDPPASEVKLSREEHVANSEILKVKLADYGIEGRIVNVHPGPVVTMYEFEPAAGVKVNQIVNLSDDIALAMRAVSVRIVAPIPGKAAVGIEIPNHVRRDVSLKEVMASEEFGSHRSKLRIALGKDIFGNAVIADLAAMPHLLVAGATGSGKSVALNAMILSIIHSARPDEVKLIMIDPKRIELSVYAGVPHLKHPVAKSASEAKKRLRKVVTEMEHRYTLLAEKNTRNIEGYNTAVTKALASAKPDDPEAPRPMPYIVVIIDELADLMMGDAREVEASIVRLAQMARAAGIHLIVATQRPSVDVLTGLIKANLGCRIAFQVSSKTDSRVILDANGAEQLLGRGDMIYVPPGTAKSIRVHGSYVSEGDIQKVVAYLKERQAAQYDAEEDDEPDEPAFGGSRAEERDEIYTRAKELVVSTGQASASFIQRRLRVGYPRAARMIELMEEDGIVGPASGSRPRELLVRDLAQLKDGADG